MENKIDIAAILKDCPRGMELDCTIYDGVTLDSVVFESEYHYENTNTYPIKIVTENGFSTRLTKYGQNVDIEEAKCVIFPKGKTTWEGFQRPFVDGDIVYTRSDEDEHINYIFIFESITENIRVNSYLYIKDGYDLKISKVWLTNCDDKYLRFATEEEKQKLFDAIKANGYHWNAETKTLEKLVEPKFKIGDRITNGIVAGKIRSRDIDSYQLDNDVFVFFSALEKWKLDTSKFDINTLKPFESRVLVRDYNSEIWRVSFWGCLLDNKEEFKYDTVRGNYKQCIPYEGNEHLLGKTNDCNYFYKTWNN